MLWKEGKDKFGRNLCFSFFIMAAQGLGALLGFGIAIMAFDLKKKGDVREIPSTGRDYWIAQMCPVNGCNDDGAVFAKVFCIEMICTFLFVTFVLVLVKHNGSSDMPINAACIGMALYCAVREASGVSGGCINPAVGLVQSVLQRTVNGSVYPNADNADPTYVMAYVVAPALGGFLAGIFQKLIYEFASNAAGEAASNEFSKMDS
jgi:glycerol uptake facilitator-like aquaporin